VLFPKLRENLTVSFFNSGRDLCRVIKSSTPTPTAFSAPTAGPSFRRNWFLTLRKSRSL
jgi:hypothetical protein